MTVRVFPAVRQIARSDGGVLAWADDDTVAVFTDEAATTAAVIETWPGGVPVPGARLTTDGEGRLPLFQADADLLYGRLVAHPADGTFELMPRGGISQEDIDEAVSTALDAQTWKPPVRAVATSNITLSGEQVVDGVSVAAGDRVLSTAQASSNSNRVWVVAAGAWTAATDTNTNAKIVDAVVLVLDGSEHQGDIYWQRTALGDLPGDGPVWEVINEGSPLLTSPDGTRHRVTVANDGTLSTEVVP